MGLVSAHGNPASRPPVAAIEFSNFADRGWVCGLADDECFPHCHRTVYAADSRIAVSGAVFLHGWTEEGGVLEGRRKILEQGCRELSGKEEWRHGGGRADGETGRPGG